MEYVKGGLLLNGMALSSERRYVIMDFTGGTDISSLDHAEPGRNEHIVLWQ